MAHSPLQFDAVVQGVFHQGLEGELGEGDLLQVRGDVDGVAHDILIPGLLNLEIAAHVLFLLPEGDDIPAPAEGVAEEGGQAGYHLYRLLGLLRLDEPDDGVHGVVEKVGVDLGLNQGQLRPAQPLLILGGLLDLTVQPAGHLFKAPVEGANLILLRLDGFPLLQAAAVDPLHPGAQLGNGPGDGPAQPDSPPGEEQHQQAGQGGDKNKIGHQLPLGLALEGVEAHCLIVKIVIHILLNEGGEDIDVVLQLALPGVVAAGVLELADFLLQVLAQAEHARDGQPAVLFGGGGQQLPGQLLGGPDLVQGQALGVLALDDVVVHLQVDAGLKVLVELRGGGHVVQQVFIPAVVLHQQGYGGGQDEGGQQQKGEDQPLEPVLDGGGTAEGEPHGLRPPPAR